MALRTEMPNIKRKRVDEEGKFECQYAAKSTAFGQDFITASHSRSAFPEKTPESFFAFNLKLVSRGVTFVVDSKRTHSTRTLSSLIC